VSGLLLGAAAVVYNRQYERERRAMLLSFQRSQNFEILGRMAAYVSQDFGKAMAAINDQAEAVLGEKNVASGTKERIKRIRKAGADGAALTEKMQLFCRQTPVENAFLDPNELVGNTISMLKGIVGEDIVFDFRPDESVWNVHGDRTLLGQAVANVVVNAREAMPEGGRIRIALRNVAAARKPIAYVRGDLGAMDRVVLQIADNGRGIGEDEIAQVFDPFFTTKEPGQGPGLGLSVALGIVKQHGGDIRIRSGGDRGTTVEIFLPRAAERREVLTAS
jgi:signal transduction histidine kinase